MSRTPVSDAEYRAAVVERLQRLSAVKAAEALCEEFGAKNVATVLAMAFLAQQDSVAAPATDCKSCQTRKRRGLEGQCPDCANDRTRAGDPRPEVKP